MPAQPGRRAGGNVPLKEPAAVPNRIRFTGEIVPEVEIDGVGVEGSCPRDKTAQTYLLKLPTAAAKTTCTQLSS